MKKILCAFVISIFPLTSVAGNLNFFSNQFHESSEDAKGHSIAIDSILSEGQYNVDFKRVHQESENNVDSYATSISADLALDSFIEGSAFIGLSYLNPSNDGAFGDSNQGFLRAGYAKINGEGIDYKVYFQTWDESVDSSLGIMLRGPLLGDALNWTVGYVRNLEIGQADLSGGLSFRF
ncbi:hypothetical protein N9I32_03845 [Porticoccaceae bacterium]|jgi:hypothetical protein|nr:hypothetical protein [Porticoccaceae bacterium]